MPQKNDAYKTWLKIITGLYILTILQRGPAHGNKLNEDIQLLTEGLHTPNPNLLYPLLRTMEEKGYITGHWDNPSTRNKRIYSITPQGVASIPAWQDKVEEQMTQLERKLAVVRRNLLEKR